MRRYSPLLLILVLLGSLAVSQSAFAARTTSPPAPTTPLLAPTKAPVVEEAEEEFEEEELGSEEEYEFEECESAAEEIEFGEMEEAEEEELEEEIETCEEEAEKGNKKGQTFVTAPEACVVQRAESTITTLPASDRVRLTVRYQNYSSAPVAIGLKLKDHKGDLGLERTTRHLGRNGVLHLTTKLGEAEMERAEKAPEFDVALRAVNTPGFCGAMLEQHLRTETTAPQAHGSRAHGSRVYNEPAKKS